MPDGNDDAGGAHVKRDLDAEGSDTPNKKVKVETDSAKDLIAAATSGEGESHTFVPPGTVGVTTINDNDVLSGRGGGTNLHPGNRQFRDLINLYRRDYLKARKNDKPAISRSIVNAIREKNGRFLKKVEKTGLWFEIGDDAAREKTSQALRQRAPEMRKLLLDHEMEGARQQQQMMGGMMAMPPGVPPIMVPGMNMPLMMPNGNMAFNPAMMGMPNAPMFNPAMMGMPPINFNQAGMPQPPGAPGQPQPGMANAPGVGDGNQANSNNNSEANNGTTGGEGGGGDANNGGSGTNANGENANNSNDSNNGGGNPNNGGNAGAGVPPNMNPMTNPMAAMNMAAMAQMNPAAMGMNMAAMAQMQQSMQQAAGAAPPVGGGAPAPESPAPVQQSTM